MGQTVLYLFIVTVQIIDIKRDCSCPKSHFLRFFRRELLTLYIVFEENFTISPQNYQYLSHSLLTFPLARQENFHLLFSFFKGVKPPIRKKRAGSNYARTGLMKIEKWKNEKVNEGHTSTDNNTKWISKIKL